MAVARIEPVRVRRFDPAGLRGKPVERRGRVPRRTLLVGAILTGGWVQHVLATTPAEPQPTPLAVVAAAAVPPAPHASTGPNAPSWTTPASSSTPAGAMRCTVKAMSA